MSGEAPQPADGLRSVTLTDDEVVALALRVGRPWPVVIPTVNMQHEQEIASAGFRGVRSLIARGLLSHDDDVLATPLDSVSDSVFEEGPALALYPASSDLGAVYRDWAVVHFGLSATEWLTDLILPRGLHVFHTASPSDCVDNTVDVLNALFRGEEGAMTLLGGDRTRRIFASGYPMQGGIRSISAKKGELLLLTSIGGKNTIERQAKEDEMRSLLHEISGQSSVAY